MKCKQISQIVLVITGIAMMSYGAVRGEAAAVLGKAIKLCLGVCRNWIRKRLTIKKNSRNTWMDTGSGHTAYQYSYSQFLSGQNISGQGENGMRPRVKLLFLSCCHGSLSHRSLSGGCRIIQIQVFLLHNRVSDSTRSDTGKIYLWLFMSLWMVSGSASQNSRKEIFHSQAEASAVSEIHHPCSFCDPSADACNKLDWNGRSLLLQVYLSAGCS